MDVAVTNGTLQIVWCVLFDGGMGGAEKFVPANSRLRRVFEEWSEFPDGKVGKHMPLRMRVHDREPIGAALRRFKKLLERSGVTKELRSRKYYEKPCELRRRAKLRKLSAIRKSKLRGPNGSFR
jgi:small subunit ribosomal protein S21